jgi:hypothetical protein
MMMSSLHLRIANFYAVERGGCDLESCPSWGPGQRRCWTGWKEVRAEATR